MKYLFTVTLNLDKGKGGPGKLTYNVSAKDDVEAREKAVRLGEKALNYEDALEILYCEITCTGEIDA